MGLRHRDHVRHPLLWIQPLTQLKVIAQNDLLIHLRWTEQFYAALHEGRWLPRWAYASQNGLGDPTFMYYQPLFYYIDGVFRLLGCSAQYALVLTGMMPFVMLAVPLYRLISPHCGWRWTLAGTALILCSPSFFYVPSSMGFYPFTLGIALSALLVIESVRAQPRVGWVAVLVCLTSISHLVSALMALCCAGLSRLLLDGLSRFGRKAHLNWLSGVVIGLGLAAFTVYPALTQMHLINAVEWTNPNLFNWRKNMLFEVYCQ